MKSFEYIDKNLFIYGKMCTFATVLTLYAIKQAYINSGWLTPEQIAALQ